MAFLRFMWLTVLALISIGKPDAVFASPLMPFSATQGVIICPGNIETTPLPDFNDNRCHSPTLDQLNPQNKELWVQISFARPSQLDQIDKPYGLFIFAKASSIVYLNGHKLGQNGQPAHDKREQVGKMDTVFYLPASLLKQDNNELVLHLSAHHSLIELKHPIHFIGIGHYARPQDYIQQFTWLGLVLLGSYLVGVLYFLKLSFTPGKRASYVIFLLLCLVAGLQLCAEISRGFVEYTYPWHDIRLLVVTACSFVFGVGVLLYTSLKLFPQTAWHWFYSGVLVTALTLIAMPSFDAKTTAGVLIPLLFSLLQLGLTWFKKREARYLRWLCIQLSITLCILVSIARFHEITYFIIVGLLLCYFFWQQAAEHQENLKNWQEDQQKIAKLEYILESHAPVHTQEKLEISIAGKLEFIDIAEIAYCKASGDYVELFLTDGSEKLYSGTLKQLETSLPNHFLRVHRSYVVNLYVVKSLSSNPSNDKTTNELMLTNGMAVPVSRRLVPSVRGSLKALS